MRVRAFMEAVLMHQLITCACEADKSEKKSRKVRDEYVTVMRNLMQIEPVPSSEYVMLAVRVRDEIGAETVYYELFDKSEIWNQFRIISGFWGPMSGDPGESGTQDDSCILRKNMPKPHPYTHLPVETVLGFEMDRENLKRTNATENMAELLLWCNSPESNAETLAECIKAPETGEGLLKIILEMVGNEHIRREEGVEAVLVFSDEEIPEEMPPESTDRLRARYQALARYVVSRMEDGKRKD